MNRAHGLASFVFGVGACAAAAACGSADPTPPAAQAAEPVVCAAGAPYRPTDSAESWSALSPSALRVTGDLFAAPSTVRFANMRPAGVQALGARAVADAPARALGADCAALYALRVDPQPLRGATTLCPGAAAGYLAVHVAEDGDRLSVAVFPAGAEPALTGADAPAPCTVFEYVR